MIRLERKRPLKLRQEEVLLRSLPINHEKRGQILENYKKGRRGYRGELELDYHLKQLSDRDYQIFKGLYLSSEKGNFQIDTLILTANVIFIIESKNLFGDLFFNQSPKQLIRTYKGKEERFPDPLEQAKRHVNYFQSWLAARKIKIIPAEPLVAIGNPRSILKTNPGMEHIFQQILHAEHIPEKITELYAKYAKSTSTSTPPEKFSPYFLQKLSGLIIEEHQEPFPNILKFYNVEPQDLDLNIRCPNCHSSKMERFHGKWVCQNCHEQNKEVYKKAIEDYMLLHGSMTNEQCRRILNISSMDLARRLLESMNLRTYGIGKGRKFFTEF